VNLNAILVDAGPLYALAFASDQYHAQARTDLARIAAAGLNVAVVYSTIVESHALVLRRSNPDFALTWLNALSGRANFILPSEDDYLQAMQLIQRYRDQPITLADGMVAVVSRRLDLAVWSYDHHFDIMRVDRWR
jgi:predicted nucleic acid-binding protein